MKKVDFSEPLFFLNLVGMHPYRKKYFPKLRQFISILIYILTISSGILELIFHSEGLKTYARAFDTMIPQTQVLFKMSVLIIFKKQVNELLISSKKFWFLEKFGKNYEKSVGQLHYFLGRFFYIYKVVITFTCIQFVAVKVIFKIKKPIIISFGENEEHGILYDRYNLILHFGISIVSIPIITGFDGLFFYFIGHILSELKMVKIAFGNTRIAPKWSQKKRFREALKHHAHVLEFAEKFNKIFSIVLLVQHLSCLFGICSALFMISKDGMPPNVDKLVKYIPYIGAFILQTWTFCFTGHLLTVWSLEIPNEIFYSDWTNDFVYKSKIERLISIQRGQKPAILTIGGFGILDLASFKLVMQKTFSFFAFINTMMNQ